MAKILLIEDNLATARLVTKILSPYGHILYHYDQGMDGLVEAPRLDLDLALIDLGLPDLNGKVICMELKTKLHAHVPIIAFTAEVGARSERLARSYGFDGFMTKPIDVHLFPAQIADWLKVSPTLYFAR